MSFDDDLNAIFDRFINNQATEADKQTLRQLIRARDGKNALQIGNNIVNIAEGRDIQIGNRTYYGTDAEAIKEALRSILQENQTQKPINCPKYIPYSGVRQFVGREKELTNLHQQLQQPRTVAISAVAGMGGVGKTELAIKYALEHQAHYPGGILFLRANQTRKVLFVADRDNLVEQALTDGFKPHIPNEPCDRIRSYNIDKTKRLYVVVEKTLRNCFKKFSPAFFDLIIFDEAHRSIFNLFQEVMEYFDARMIGLTATPAGFIDRNTFNTFHCFDGIPTFLYPYKRAVDEGYLVDFSFYQAQTKFQRQGIQAANLTEEDRNALIQQGIDADNLDYSGSELEKNVSNKDTLRKQ